MEPGRLRFRAGPAPVSRLMNRFAPPADAPFLSRLLGCADARTSIWLTGAYTLYAFIALLLILHQDSAFGQDYRYHMDLTLRALEQPGSLFWFDKTNPSLLYILGAAMWFLFGDPGFVYATSALFVPLTVWGFHLMFLLGRRLCDDEKIVALFVVFALFIPLTPITATAYAADALTPVPFFGFVYALLRFAESDAPSARRRWTALAGLAAFTGALAKFTFMAILAVGPAALAVLAVYRRVRLSDLPTYALCVLLLPGALIVVERMENSRYELHGISFPRLSGAMTLDSLFLPKKNDLYLLTAPSPGEPILVNGKQAMVNAKGEPVAEGGLPGYRLLADNAHSFPGLFHLGIYTDIMDLADKGLLDGWGWGKRSSLTQAFQTASVNLGLLFSVLIPLGVAATLLRGLGGLGRAAFARFSGDKEEDDKNIARLLLLGIALALFVPVVGMLPFMTMPYYMGYWLPRLMYAPVLAFGLFTFIEVGRGLDALSARRPVLAGRLRKGFFIAALSQAFLGLGCVLAPSLG